MNIHNCIYCKSSLVDGYCPVCEPKHFAAVQQQYVVNESEKGRPSKPGPK